MLLSRESAKSTPSRRKVKIAAGIARLFLGRIFHLTTPPVEIAAIRSKDEFFEVPFDKKPPKPSIKLKKQYFYLRFAPL